MFRQKHLFSYFHFTPLNFKNPSEHEQEDIFHEDVTVNESSI